MTAEITHHSGADESSRQKRIASPESTGEKRYKKTNANNSHTGTYLKKQGMGTDFELV